MKGFGFIIDTEGWMYFIVGSKIANIAFHRNKDTDKMFFKMYMYAQENFDFLLKQQAIVPRFLFGALKRNNTTHG